MKFNNHIYKVLLAIAILFFAILLYIVVKDVSAFPEHYWKYLILSFIFLLTTIILLAVLSFRTHTFFKVLKHFTEMVHSGREDFDEINFPKNKYGSTGEELMQSFIELKNAERYKQELTHNIAHELKTPVTSIRGYLETILHQPDIDSETRNFFIERAYNQCVRLSSIIADISVLNNIEEAGENLETEPVDIKKCIQEIRNDLSVKLADKGITFIDEIEDNLVVEGNPFLIYALFKNLIDNSIEHGGENITIFVKGWADANNIARFTLYDTGVGVSEKHLKRIFERFYRVDEGRNRKKGGSGLGLAIVKHTIILHKGKISVHNRERGGLHFDFSLSLSEDTNAD